MEPRLNLFDNTVITKFGKQLNSGSKVVWAAPRFPDRLVWA
jgi:hypothetical protein